MGHGWQRLRLLLVACEMALALVLLIGASLMIRSFFRLQEVNIGLDPLNVLTMNTTLTVDRYPAPRQITFYRDVVERIGALPGVTSVGAIDNLPLGGSDVHSFGIVGRSAWDPGDELSGEFSVVTPQYFHAIGIPLTKVATLLTVTAVRPPGSRSSMTRLPAVTGRRKIPSASTSQSTSNKSHEKSWVW